MRLIDADEFFRNYPELAIEPYINAPTIEQKYYERIIAQINPNISDEDIEKFKAIWQRTNNKGLFAINEDRPTEKPDPEADPKSGDLISRENLREQIDDCKYFNNSFQKMTVAEFLTIVHDIINDVPTIELTEEQAIDKLHETGWLIRHDKEMTERPHIIDNCDMNVFEPEKMIQTPSCLTNPERHEELLERYKEGEYGER